MLYMYTPQFVPGFCTVDESVLGGKTLNEVRGGGGKGNAKCEFLTNLKAADCFKTPSNETWMYKYFLLNHANCKQKLGSMKTGL